MDMNDKLLRRLLIDAALEKAEEDEREFKPSDRFKITLNKNLKANGIKPYYSFLSIKRHRALVIIAAVITAFALSMSVGAVREAVGRFFVKMYDGFAVIFTDNNAAFPETIEELFIPAYIPEGFEMSDRNETSNRIKIKWSKANDEVIFCQYTKKVVSNVDTEHRFERIDLFGENDGVLSGENGDISIYFERYGYYFTISTYGETSEKDLIKMAKSIEKVEFTKS